MKLLPRHIRRRGAAVLVAFLLSLSLAAVPRVTLAQDAAPPSSVEDRLKQLEAQLGALQAEIGRLRAEAAKPAPAAQPELEAKVDALTEEMEKRRLGSAFQPVGESRHGLGPAASKVYDVDRGVSIGGYGEMLYESFESTRDDGSRSSKKDQLDFLRGVLYFGYKFDDRILFNSELEFEHASTGKDGEVSFEVAYVDFLLREEANLRAGLMLVPMGFVNEMHEPTTFLSARRPEVERRIIPSTWRENGVGLFGAAGKVSYRAALLAGFDSSGFDAGSGLRGGRQSGSVSLAEDLAFVARVDAEPLPGLLLGASGYTGHSGQDAKTLAGDEIEGKVTLWDVHAQYQNRGLFLRGLWTEGRIGDAAEINEANGLTGDDSVGSKLNGWYAELGWDVLAHRETDQELTPFVRHEDFDTQASVPAGVLRDRANDRQILTLGVAYKPHPQVVIKADWQDWDNGAGTGNDQYNLAVGYNF